MRTNFRTAITIPERSWVRFRDVLSEFVNKQPSGPIAGGSGGDGSAIAAAGNGNKEMILQTSGSVGSPTIA